MIQNFPFSKIALIIMDIAFALCGYVNGFMS